MSVVIAITSLIVSSAAIGLSLWSLKLSRDADFNARVIADADFRRAHAESSADA